MEVIIPKDIREYKAKLIANFTFRECVGLAIMAAGSYAMYGLYKVISPSAAFDTMAGLFCFIGAAPGILYGFIKPYGMPIENFMKTVFVENFLCPSIRKYKTDPLFEKEKAENIKLGKMSTAEYPGYK